MPGAIAEKSCFKLWHKYHAFKIPRQLRPRQLLLDNCSCVVLLRHFHVAMRCSTTTSMKASYLVGMTYRDLIRDSLDNNSIFDFRHFYPI